MSLIQRSSPLSTPNSSNVTKIIQVWRWLGIFVWLGVAAAILINYHDRLYSTSIDVGLHGTLVSRLMENSNLPAVDENLAEMATYPRLAHSAAALAGVELHSALDGMQYIAYFSFILLWSSIGYGFLRLPIRKRSFSFFALTIALLANRQWFGLELFGSELVATYFFAHFVAQALASCLLVIAVQLEWSRPRSYNHLLLLGLGGVLLTSAHLLPAVELIGTLGVLVILSAFVDSGEKRKQRFVTGAGIALFSVGLTVVNPDFMAMYRLSSNNGLMRLNHIHSVRDVAVLAVGVSLFSLSLIALWWRKQRVDASYEGLLLKYFGTFGFTVSGLCAIQILLYFGFSKGSEYACFKYATGLQSLLVLNAILLISQLVKDREPTSEKGPSVFIPAALTALACACVFPKDNFVLTEKIVSAEREARAFANSREKPAAGTHNFAIGIAEIGGFGNYLVSLFSLGTPPLGNSFEILMGNMPKNATDINQILTSRSSDPWDIRDCRRGTTGSLISLDGACVYSQFTTLKCADTIEFTSRGTFEKATSGFSTPGPNGRWSEGATATLTCDRVDPAPTIAYFDTAGLVSETHSQHMLVWVNGKSPQTIEYSVQSPSRTIELPLPADNSPQLTFRFEFPDAISPAELGMNTDGRKLAVFVFRLRFK